jgi:ABC-2 type transport system permease protein
MNWSQLKAIIWLRGRLSWNRFSRGGALNAIVAVIILASFIVGIICSAVAGFLAGYFALAHQRPQALLAAWDGIIIVFCLFWVVGLLAEIQRSESVDMAKLLHLPLSLQQVFIFNYVASHVTAAILLMVPGMVSLSLGLALGAGVRMALLIPLALGFVFAITSWTYCLRGWLAALMVNKRRRRAIVVWITLGFVLFFQLPGLLINSRLLGKPPLRRPRSAVPSNENVQFEQAAALARIVRAHVIVPLGWPGYGAMSLKQGSAWPALGAIALSVMVGALGLMKSYRTTLRFYQGAADGTESPRPLAKPGYAHGTLLVERQLPLLADDTAALTLATFRSLLRAPELKMALIMPIVAGAGLSSILFRGFKYALNHSLAGFASTVAAVLAVFSFAPMMANAFGLDRDGFRGLVLLPTRRDQILLAKNLAFLPFIAFVGVILLSLASFALRVPWVTSITGLLQIGIAFLLFSLMCNLVAILTPYRLAPGTLQAKKPKPVVFLAIAITMMAMPIFLFPTFIPPVLQLACSLVAGMPEWLPVNLLSAILVLLGLLWLYRILLPTQGRLLQRRELHILREVTEETE